MFYASVCFSNMVTVISYLLFIFFTNGIYFFRCIYLYIYIFNNYLAYMFKGMFTKIFKMLYIMINSSDSGSNFFFTLSSNERLIPGKEDIILINAAILFYKYLASTAFQLTTSVMLVETRRACDTMDQRLEENGCQQMDVHYQSLALFWGGRRLAVDGNRLKKTLEKMEINEYGSPLPCNKINKYKAIYMFFNYRCPFCNCIKIYFKSSKNYTFN